MHGDFGEALVTLLAAGGAAIGFFLALIVVTVRHFAFVSVGWGEALAWLGGGAVAGGIALPLLLMGVLVIANR